MTHEESISEINSITRTCKGYLTKEARNIISYQFEEYTRTGNDFYLTKARLLDSLNRGRLDIVIVDTSSHIDTKGRLIEDMVTSTDQVLRLTNGPGCGYNFNKIIESNPWDGVIREYQCPQCGVQGEYQAPLF
jgi:hypothetical protein